MALHTQYRPKEFSEMVGNRNLVKSVEAILGKKRIPHSWLFTGISGVGKTTIARIIASKLKASPAGIMEINNSQFRGIDDVRELISNARYKVLGSPVSVYILDEFHGSTRQAQNALLKILEDPYPHCYFILCTTDPQKLIAAVRTRCEEFRFAPVEFEDLLDLIVRTASAEEIELSEEVLLEIAGNASGSPRLALNMLEKCMGHGTDIKAVRQLISGLGIDFQQAGNTEFEISGKLFKCMENARSLEATWRQIVNLMKQEIFEPGLDFKAVRQGLLNRFGQHLLYSANARICEAIVIIETHSNMYSKAAFIAMMFRLVETFTSHQTPVRTTRIR